MKLIADNLRVTIPVIQKALKDKNPSSVISLVKECTQKGAWAIDVNTGPLGRMPEKGMQFFMDAVQSATHLPLVIDTSNPTAMEAGLGLSKGRAIINGFSLEPKKIEKILPLAKTYDADIVGFLLYPDSSVPKDANDRFEIALDLFEAAEAAGVAKERIIIDPVVPPLAWENGIVQAREVLTVIQTLQDLSGFPVRTIAGISNLATRARDKDKKRRITQSYLSMLAAAGLSYALIDILDDELVKMAKTADILVSEDLFSWGMLPE
ncbi:MAG: dihydropteroate synthase [Desulfobacula sp.]|nr:dihydropteroate synthase [Desulfobacula sp.]